MESPYLVISALRGAGITCLLTMLIAGRPVTARWLSAKTCYSENTVAKTLVNLASEGMIRRVQNPSGWMLVPHRILKMLFLAIIKNLKNYVFFPLKLSESDIDIDNTSDLLNLTEESAIIEDGLEKEPDLDSSQAPDQKGDQGSDQCTDQEPDQKTDQEPDQKTDQGNGFSWEDFQAATEDLFGEPVMISKGGEEDKSLALALVAEAHVNRCKLGKPARVVYANLKKKRRPLSRFLKDPCSLLPLSFLNQLGLTISRSNLDQEYIENPSTQDGCECDFDEEPLEEPEQERISPLDGSLEEPIEEGSPLTRRQVWERSVESMVDEVPMLVRDRYLKQIVPVAFRPEVSEFLVTARDDDVVYWSADRLSSVLKRKLVSFGKREVRLRFEPLSRLPVSAPLPPPAGPGVVSNPGALGVSV